ncbi:hypothetical protein BT69DRAFT_1200044, partial [Atractiella rhizophila]
PQLLFPKVKAQDRILQWKPEQHIQAVYSHPRLQNLVALASAASLDESTRKSYGSGLAKYLEYCEKMNLPQNEIFPASKGVILGFGPKKLVTPQTAQKYVTALHSWHTHHGLPFALSSKEDWDYFHYLMRGAKKLRGEELKAPRPPVTLHMLRALHTGLDFRNSFDSCCWAVATSTFFGLMR